MHLTKEMSRDPEHAFVEPKQLIECGDLSDEEKLSLLESWHADLVELQRATEENMGPANVSPGANAAKLASVTEAIAQMRERLRDPS